MTEFAGSKATDPRARGATRPRSSARGRRRRGATVPDRTATVLGRAAPFLETALDAPVRRWLEARGYEVRSEVHGCDLVARRDDELIVVELKRRFGIDLLAQAARRQRVCDSVYLAVPRGPRRDAALARDVQHVLRRLELGLLLVSLGRRPRVDVLLHPEPFTRRRSPAQRRSLLAEVAARRADWNRGGSTRRPLVTAYRERALHVALCLQRIGASSPARLRALGTGEKTRSILYHDVYGWFSRTGRACYELASAGAEALVQFADVASTLRAEVDEALAREASARAASEATAAQKVRA